MTEKITIIGTGNVAHHLGKRFKETGFTINQIVGRNAEKAAQLASLLGADFSINFINALLSGEFLCDHLLGPLNGAKHVSAHGENSRRNDRNDNGIFD